MCSFRVPSFLFCICVSFVLSVCSCAELKLVPLLLKQHVHKHLVNVSISVIQENNEMGGACSAYGGGERCVQGFGGET